MVDENDSFIREVNEELRSDQLKSVWKRFGRLVIALAVLVVVGTVAHRGYVYWREDSASQSGDQFLAALKLSDEGKQDEAIAALAQLEKEGHGAYPVLARLRTATAQAEKGETQAAIDGFTAVGADTKVPSVLRDVARMRAGWLLIDAGTYEQVSAQVEVLTVPASSLRHSAREALGLAAYKAGDMAKARGWFTQITEDAEAPRNVTNRAQMMLDNIAATGKAP
ncbi:tetratricopeptide repeat protein [Rhizobium sp. RU36D]|uniref:tetratricopeptide repeat protein n=1 Tax=Rhizobium sp. RU36D TaxID=1907415 RepID=UPI0009D8E151|nr:tetratricopeptide repeat protein [Rhizobium sp. RU36D]SMD03252.1 hypothetical protein SAMN05880593_11695 [Rhizobium sp. RU36D]